MEHVPSPAHTAGVADETFYRAAETLVGGPRRRARRIEREDRAVGIGEAGAELVIAALRPEVGRGREQDLAQRVGLEAALQLEQQGGNAADLRGRDRGSGRELITAAGRRRQNVDAGRRDRDMPAAACYGQQMIMSIGSRSPR
jgi:hypothetical protein